MVWKNVNKEKKEKKNAVMPDFYFVPEIIKLTVFNVLSPQLHLNG